MATQPSRLSDSEIKHFHDQGYLQFNKPVFSESRFGELKALFEEHLQAGSDLDTIHFRDPRLMPFLMADEVLDLVEPLIGSNIGLWSSHFISKAAKTGKATPWHEDTAYWNGRMEPMSNIITVWLAIDAAFPENGSMGVIPGSHDNGFSTYERVDTEQNIFGERIVDVDESKAVYFTLAPNECTLHEGRIIHGAQPNTSEFRRTGYTMRYFPTSNRVLQESDRNAGHKIWLARGKDLAGNRFENG